MSKTFHTKSEILWCCMIASETSKDFANNTEKAILFLPMFLK